MYGTNVSGPGVAALPFTGIEVGWMLLAAIMLLAVGASIWRLVPREEE